MSAAKPNPGSQKRAAIDWREVRLRVDAARAAIERTGTADAGETKRILKARALALAREATRAGVAEESIEVVEFLLSHENYAVESAFVREVYPLENLTALPCTPPFVAGIVNVRGEMLSVIDLRRFFDLPAQGLTDLNKVVVLYSKSMLFGVLADAVVGVRRVPVAQIQPSLPTLTGIRERYLKGVTPARTVILDAEKLLNDESIVVREQLEG